MSFFHRKLLKKRQKTTKINHFRIANSCEFDRETRYVVRAEQELGAPISKRGSSMRYAECKEWAIGGGGSSIWFNSLQFLVFGNGFSLHWQCGQWRVLLFSFCFRCGLFFHPLSFPASHHGSGICSTHFRLLKLFFVGIFGLFLQKRRVDEDCGGTPQTTRRRRVLPISDGIIENIVSPGWIKRPSEPRGRGSLRPRRARSPFLRTNAQKVGSTEQHIFGSLSDSNARCGFSLTFN